MNFESDLSPTAAEMMGVPVRKRELHERAWSNVLEDITTNQKYLQKKQRLDFAQDKSSLDKENLTVDHHPSTTNQSTFINSSAIHNRSTPSTSETKIPTERKQVLKRSGRSALRCLRSTVNRLPGPVNRDASQLPSPPMRTKKRVMQPKRRVYVAWFTVQVLGLELGLNDGKIQIRDVVNPMYRNTISIGDWMLAVNGLSVEGKSLEVVAQMIQEAKRPMTIYLTSGAGTSDNEWYLERQD